MKCVSILIVLLAALGLAGCGNEEEQRRLRAAHMTDEQLRQYATTRADPAMKAIAGDEIARRKKLREQAAKRKEKKPSTTSTNAAGTSP